MSKMTVIQLLNKMANGEEVPKKIKYTDEDCDTYIYELEKDNSYWCKEVGNWLFSSYEIQTILNDEIEIIEEEKKIPEKLKIEQDTPTSNYYIRNENGTKCALTKHSKMIAETLNQVIDYLKSKGE